MAQLGSHQIDGACNLRQHASDGSCHSSVFSIDQACNGEGGLTVKVPGCFVRLFGAKPAQA